MIPLPILIGLRCRGRNALVKHPGRQNVAGECGQRLQAKLFPTQVSRSPFDQPAIVPHLRGPHLMSACRCFAKKRVRLSEYDEYEQSTHPSRVPLTFVNVPIHHQSASELVDTVVVAGRLRLKNPNFWRRCTTAVTDLVCGFRVRELVAIVNAYAKARYRDEQLFSCLAKAIGRQVSQCRPSDIAVAAQAFARMNIRECDFMDVLGGEASRRLHEMGPRGIAMLAWSYGRLGIFHYALFGGIFRELLDNVDTFSSLDLTQVIWAFGELKVSDVAVLSRICDKLQSHLPHQTLSESLICTHALPRMLFFDHDVLSELRSLYVQRLRELPLAELPLLLHTFARLDRQCAPHERPPPSTRLHQLLVKAILNNISYYKPADIERTRSSLAAAEMADDFLDDVVSSVLPSQIRAMTVQDKIGLLEFYRFSAAPNWTAIADIVTELFPSSHSLRLRDWHRQQVSEEHTLRCLESLAAIGHREAFLYVLQSLKEADDAEHIFTGTAFSSYAPEADNTEPLEASVGKNVLRGAASLVIHRLLCQMMPTEAEFLALLEESFSHRSGSVSADTVGPAVSRLEDCRRQSPSQAGVSPSPSRGARGESRGARNSFSEHLGSFLQLVQGDALRPNASRFNYMGRTVKQNEAVSDTARQTNTLVAQPPSGASKNGLQAPPQSFWTFQDATDVKSTAGDAGLGTSEPGRIEMHAKEASETTHSNTDLLDSSSIDTDTLLEQRIDASSELDSSRTHATGPQRSSQDGDGEGRGGPTASCIERTPGAERLRLDPNILNLEFYNALRLAVTNAEPHDLVAALIRFPRDPARGLWIHELVTKKLEALEPEYLPGVLLELGKHLKQSEDFETNREEVESHPDTQGSHLPLLSPEQVEAYISRVFECLFSSLEAVETEERETLRQERHPQRDYPRLTALSNSALAVVVKMLEVYSDRETAQGYAVACASLFLRRLATANGHTISHSGTEERAERTTAGARTSATQEQATAKQLARIFHSLISLDVLPSQGLCIELARRVGLLSSPDLFTVLRNFAALGCCDEPVAAHLLLGLSVRKFQIKSWKKMRELEFLCSRLGVDLEDGLPTGEGGQGKERGAYAPSIADALGREDDESLGAVELPNDSELPKLEDELDQEIAERVERRHRQKTNTSQSLKTTAAP
ncbi:hypothetical protein TGPRC2_271240 [Toxoplasma gondii TgCatPRC2]|uniref:RNA-editing substrate-binding complex 6 protein domain-containing protein n=3 Tax=Toxoplasma gondii TaxID=5811 RepID=A0A151HP92_TOXGO|nr:hypothetical protein TGME49_271240 [Toxoplasma gondii ME49]EPT28496.1 hypothetical protein TGME49_271240 [Toxoplasma gondii ME49]KYF46898.1 hypothetical protein TGARI_271240 [Toxoplasma gondii ARI]KYK71138.1 hypothetical protein TGPRC2_271240 [Toxoplasma gondii TgCatPRC2]|eukprot:XP_018636647.1 hypothetical protein TGME49_271240 [Toxoplasma gondii ME49]